MKSRVKIQMRKESMLGTQKQLPKIYLGHM